MDFEEYKKLLDKAYSELPEILKTKSRLEIPKVKGRIERNRTIIYNFKDIVNTFGRNENHLLKFFLKEVGVRGEINGNIIVLHSKFNPIILNKIVKKYYKEYVECPVCKRPDTELKDNELICRACGAKTSVKPL